MAEIQNITITQIRWAWIAEIQNIIIKYFELGWQKNNISSSFSRCRLPQFPQSKKLSRTDPRSVEWMLQRWSPGFPLDASPENNLDIFLSPSSLPSTSSLPPPSSVWSSVSPRRVMIFVILHFQPSLSLGGALGDLNLRVNMLKCDLVGHSNHPR